MAARRGKTPEDRAAAADRDIRAHVAAGNTRAMLHRARDAAEAELALIRRTDPARADLLTAALAGSWHAISSTLAAQQPPRVPGYRGGPPSAAHLNAAYDIARTQTLGQGQTRR